MCAYDRRGYGWSSPLPLASSDSKARSIRETTLELKLLLKASGEKPPFILVGHSVGGMCVTDASCWRLLRVEGFVIGSICLLNSL